MPNVSFLAAGGWETTIEDHRQLTKAIFGQGSGALNAASYSPLPVNDELAIDLLPGHLVIEGEDHSSQGSYLFWDDETQRVAGVSPGVQPRVDSILAVVADSQYGTLIGEAGPRFVWATGTAAASPVALSDSEIDSAWAEPGAWIRIADVLVSPGVTEFISSDITPKLSVLAQAGQMVGLVHEPSASWPANSTFITTVTTQIGAGAAGQTTAQKATRTINVREGRCYKITMSVYSMLGNGAANPGDHTAIVRLSYELGSNITLDGASSILYQERIPLLSTVDSKCAGGSVITYVNNFPAGTYTFGALLRTDSATVGARVLAPWTFAVEDAGPAV